MDLSVFKAYDIRGSVPEQINNDFSFYLGLTLQEVIPSSNVIVGYDARNSSKLLSGYLISGLSLKSNNINCIGLCGTEEIYYACANHDYDLGIMVTGSHNPINQNGFKIVKRGAIPVSGDSGLYDIRDKIINIHKNNIHLENTHVTSYSDINYRNEYIQWLVKYTGISDIRNSNLRVIIDSGNGSAGPFLKELTNYVPFYVDLLNETPDGSFPNGVPNPLLPNRRSYLSNIIKNFSNIDFGVAFDGDFDRCFFYDGDGNFIDGYYIVGLLASELLHYHPNEKIIYDPRVYWNIKEIILKNSGIPIMSKTGHAFIKERMRSENALYGGEMSSHHYFRDFSYCDSGMIPFLLISSLIIRTKNSLSDLVSDGMSKYPCSGEINFEIPDNIDILSLIKERYFHNSLHVDYIDGINIEFSNWRFNIRFSNTEPILRLNAESNGDKSLLNDKVSELTDILKNYGVNPLF